MINPNKTHNIKGTILAIEHHTSMTVYKVSYKGSIFDYTVFGPVDTALVVGDIVNAVIAFSVITDTYYIKSMITLTKAA